MLVYELCGYDQHSAWDFRVWWIFWLLGVLLARSLGIGNAATVVGTYGSTQGVIHDRSGCISAFLWLFMFRCHRLEILFWSGYSFSFDSCHWPLYNDLSADRYAKVILTHGVRSMRRALVMETSRILAGAGRIPQGPKASTSPLLLFINSC